MSSGEIEPVFWNEALLITSMCLAITGQLGTKLTFNVQVAKAFHKHTGA